MTSSIQFSGITSGLDYSSIISSLMEVESAPQTALKNRLASVQSQVTSLQQVNTALTALSESAQSFKTGSTWAQLSATSSNSAVTVTASSSAAAASFGVTVKQSATAAHALLTATDLASATGTITIAGTDGTKATFDASKSLAEIAAAINADSKASGLQAQLINGADGGPTLAIVATSTGDAANFTITKDDGSELVATTEGHQAQITLSNGVTVNSQSNTFTDLMPGINVTIPANVTASTDPTTAVTSQVAVTADGATRANALKAFVNQINALTTQIAGATAYGTTVAGQGTTGGGVLPGDQTLRSIAQQLVGTIFPPAGTKPEDFKLNSYGLSVDRDGQLTFDQDKFSAAYAADPDAVQQAFTGPGGFSEQVKKVADLASDSHTGTLTQYIASDKATADRYSDQIDAWDDRLAAKQASLEQVYTNLETQLTKLTAQQSWLTNALSSLDSGWMQNSK